MSVAGFGPIVAMGRLASDRFPTQTGSQRGVHEMRNDKGTIALVAEETETDLWAIKSLIQRYGVSVITLSSGDKLLEGMRNQSIQPAVVLLSARCANGHVSDTISRIKDVDDSMPVVVAVKENSLELEREMRRRGIFYYLILPAGHDEIEKVVLSALRAADVQ